MYRSADQRASTPPTIIEYESKLVRKRMFVVGLVFALVAAFLYTGLETGILGCDPTTCRLDNYGVWVRGERHIQVPRDQVMRVHAVARGSGKNKYADAHLLLKSGSPIDLSGAAWLGRLQQDVTLEAAASFNDSFTRQEPNFRVWLRPHAATLIMLALFGAGLWAMAFGVFREQVRQHRKIRIVIDHDAGVVRANKREMRIADVASVSVESGEALFWTKKKHETIIGHRVVLHSKNPDAIALVGTTDFRAGPKQDHDKAAREVTGALGLAGREPHQHQHQQQQGKKKKKKR